MRLSCLSLCAAAVLVACGGSGSDRSPARDAARELVANGARSAVALVANGSETDVAAAGRGSAPDQRFRIGSVTKTFTAVIVLQIVDDGLLRLGDPVARYLPGLVPSAREITIQQLLQHRSGLANVTDDATWLERAERSSTIGPREALRFAVSRPPVFPAGSSWGYSNTNYIALGLVIERITGRSYAQELSRRILEPLELGQTELATTRRLPDLDDAGTNPKLPWAAGGIVSSARDLARFYSALMSGDLLSAARLAEMKQAAGAAAGEGLGLVRGSAPCGPGWGHGGTILDYLTEVAASEHGRRVAVISVRAAVPLSVRDQLSELFCAEL